MACHFPRTHLWINVERIRASMNVDLLQHAFDRAVAFIGNGEGRVNAGGDLRSNPRRCYRKSTSYFSRLCQQAARALGYLLANQRQSQ
jgi:hypothetical protein